MDNNAYAFLLKYSSPYSILVVTKEDRLVELSCPFEVEVIKDVKYMMIGEKKEVTLVKLATNNKLVYIIDDKPYFYCYFNIII
ncbi:hypothetical protein [Flavobacterium sp. M31R6]|uniref:hypothetical protein n=1 Tax=Flavobacterium sp. M31R6 TaxID=2739062 RepID=UPI001569A1CD|nr:hypothetical protein [Flavobacterium sp. M31R6]QKJ63340.1 hypothetical protein HQN62_09405 [Flavobacterium sp. M31R6]